MIPGRIWSSITGLGQVVNRFAKQMEMTAMKNRINKVAGRRPGPVQRRGVAAGFALAGAATGLGAATATIGNTWIRMAWAVACGVAGLVGGTMAGPARH